MILSRSYLLRMRNLSDECCRENQDAHLIFASFSENRTVCEIMWKNLVKPDRSHDNIIGRMRIACWITKATSTHSEYVILIARQLHQWLCDSASMLRYTYIACLV